MIDTSMVFVQFGWFAELYGNTLLNIYNLQCNDYYRLQQQNCEITQIKSM